MQDVKWQLMYRAKSACELLLLLREDLFELLDSVFTFRDVLDGQEDVEAMRLSRRSCELFSSPISDSSPGRALPPNSLQSRSTVSRGSLFHRMRHSLSGSLRPKRVGEPCGVEGHNQISSIDHTSAHAPRAACIHVSPASTDKSPAGALPTSSGRPSEVDEPPSHPSHATSPDPQHHASEGSNSSNASEAASYSSLPPESLRPAKPLLLPPHSEERADCSTSPGPIWSAHRPGCARKARQGRRVPKCSCAREVEKRVELGLSPSRCQPNGRETHWGLVRKSLRELVRMGAREDLAYFKQRIFVEVLGGRLRSPWELESLDLIELLKGRINHLDTSARQQPTEKDESAASRDPSDNPPTADKLQECESSSEGVLSRVSAQQVAKESPDDLEREEYAV
ncbi:MAG: hypothetical protein SGPRY_010660 [Prymnesium sp.]